MHNGNNPKVLQLLDAAMTGSVPLNKTPKKSNTAEIKHVVIKHLQLLEAVRNGLNHSIH